MKTKGYSAIYIAVGPEDTYVPDDHETSVTRGMWHSHEGEKHYDRVSLLQDIYMNTRMIENDPRPDRVPRCTIRRVTRREQGHHEPVDRLDE